MNEIIIPREWIMGLLQKVDMVNQSQGEIREAWIANLLGYIESSKSFL